MPALTSAVIYSIKVRGSDAKVVGSPEGGEEFVLPSGGSFKALAIAAATMLKGEKAILEVTPKCEH